MKKITLVFSALILILTSCSSDDENNSNQNLILLKKSISTGLSGNVRTTDYVYDGNKIVSATTGTLRFNYFYTNDLITKIEVYYNQILSNTIILTYNSSQKLIERVANSVDNQESIREVYSYNNDSTIGVLVYRNSLDFDNQLVETSKMFLGTNQEIVKKEIYRTDGTEIVNYEYDNKNNIFKNVLNLKKLLLFDSNDFNLVSIQDTFNGEILYSRNSQFIYNSDGFPITNSSTVVNGSSTDAFTIQHFYE